MKSMKIKIWVFNPNIEIKREFSEPSNQIEPMDSTDGLRDITVSRKKPLRVRNIIQEDEKFAAPKGNFKESRRP